ncbi:hypothetical protein SAMN02745135_01504 [Caloranaerobacter azorensis DSM 13643]|uniref:Uncharacterized protein n=1 Tax=Caloranaerobacter azorensis DSM 13643 TaxID=1121264 RepID=A0A1M5UNG0_9FIRM|nr:hypothetical protein [Caloranaerobacter azorensis]SHH64497.1 hypothetical protein SAMN02745135_01504 [Caloranaerobacter azorensis DSM 13643]
MYLEQQIINKGRKIRGLIIFAYCVVMLIALIKYNFKTNRDLFMYLGIMLFALIAFYRGNKFIGDMLFIGLTIILGLLPIYILHYFQVDKVFGGILYIIILAICFILGIKSKIYEEFRAFMKWEHRKKTKTVYYLENVILITMIVIDKII